MYIFLHMPRDSLISGFLMLWAERNRAFVPTDMCERTKCVQRLLERSGEDKGGPGRRRLASHWRHWEVAASMYVWNHGPPHMLVVGVCII